MISQIRVGAIRYPIIEDPDLHNKHRGKKYPLAGQIDFTETVIRVRTPQTDDTRAETLIHEALHAVLWHAGLGHLNDEQPVTALGYGVIALIRDNPELVKLIVEGREPTQSEGGENGSPSPA